MNSITKSLLGVSAGVILGSCADRDPQAVVTPGNTEITAAIVEAGRETRSAIDQTEYAGGAVGIVWTPEDRLGVFSASSLNSPFANADNAKAGRVKFKGDLSGTPLYAYYPYSEINNGRQADNLAGTLPLSQQWDANTQEIDGDYKFGTPRSGAENEFDFTHLFSLLKFTVNATGTAIQGETLKSVSMTLPAGRVLGGDFTFSAIDGKYNFGSTAEANKMTLNWTSPIALSTGISATGYMSCAPDIQANDELTITVTTDRKTATFTAHAAFAFEAGAVYSFNLNLKQIENLFGLTVEEIPAEKEEETANCYMITTAGEHDFKATVIGNGEKGIIKGAGFHTEDPYINPASAKLLWEDVQGFISDVRLIDGRVHYTTTGNVGNAVIAVYSDTDGKGDILWSWHIWGVGDTLPQDFNLDTKGGSTFSMMDRDLGAFPATDEERMQETRDESVENNVLHAMLYQWGRKDPFPNTGSYYVDGNEVAIGKSGYPLAKPATAEEATIDFALRNPATFIDLYSTCSISDWIGTHNDLLWGDERSSGEKDGDWTNVKTIYDPSPVGYRVPNYYAFSSYIPVNSNSQQLKGVMSQNATTGMPTLSENINCVIQTYLDGTTERWLPKGIHRNRIGMSVDNKKMHGYGIYMKRNADDTEGNFFAQTGFISPNGILNEYGISSHRWMSCGATTTGINSASFQLYYFAWRTAQSDYTDSDHNKGLPAGSAGVVGTIKTQNALQSRYACAVRCVRE